MVTGYRRGQVWSVDFGSPRGHVGHEQAKRRPALIVSADFMNESESGLTIVVPITSTLRPVRSHIRLQPPEGGVTVESAIQCEQIRAMSGDRLVTQLGRVGTETMNTVERVLGLILDLA